MNFYTVTQLAEQHNVDTWTIRDVCKARSIEPTSRVGRAWLFDEAGAELVAAAIRLHEGRKGSIVLYDLESLSALHGLPEPVIQHLLKTMPPPNYILSGGRAVDGGKVVVECPLFDERAGVLLKRAIGDEISRGGSLQELIRKVESEIQSAA